MTNKVQLNAATQLANLGEELNVPFLKLLGVRLISAEMGKGEIFLALKPEHTNTWDVAHGGVLLTLMDVAMAVAARSSDPSDRSVVTVEMKNNFMQAANGILRVKADTVRRTATMAFCEAKLYNDQGEICCMATGTFQFLKRLAAKDANGERVVNADSRQK
ncbi:PaaI family thioesterase [Polynucleobacter sp. MG-27-Goln-C1]|uniref:PaaI family thioesterase n=1 Tax=Polynucleobacter sp. MG-27-Goln-C1 TaxID=1819726 RepID=UPI001C0E8CE2|nr:PaaI family thioesterase [Polynucleobacter sp. MG-27-Goln-C1]MBU3611759.1 PaaI family thioesterase [Polynucleobacter sp. MG-27-Goln-C1]